MFNDPDWPDFDFGLYDTPHGVDYDSDERRRERWWAWLIFWIKALSAGIGTLAIWIIIAALVGLAGWLIAVFVIHYTLPAKGWLTPEALSVLTGGYRTFTAFAAPLALMTNAWLIAYITNWGRGRRDSL